MSRDGRVWIVFNGEIYNFKELRTELEDLGYRFQSESDTEVILAAYEEWDTECVLRFNGDWAFCIYDSARHRLFCSRDRLGVKPFYYFESPECLAFASEIKALFTLPFVPREWEPDLVATFVLCGVSDFSGATMYRWIRQLEPACNLLIDTRHLGMQVSRYWRPAFNPGSGQFRRSDEQRYAREVRELVEDAVRIRLRADVPVGSCLSGGIDSATIVAVIHGLVRRQVPDAAAVGDRQLTFTAAYKGEAIDEEHWARSIIQLTGADARFVYPSSEGLELEVNNLMAVQDEVFISTSVYAQYKVMQRASGQVKVLLDGQGADELFGGYPSYRDYQGIRQVVASSHLRGALRRKLLRWAPHFMRKATVKTVYSRNIRLIERLLGRSFRLQTLMEVLDARLPSNLNEALFLDAMRFKLQQLLKYEDRNSQHFQVEARVPFTDHRLVEYVFNIPACYKLHHDWTKYILRRAFEGVIPRETSWRKDKIGFQTPERKWLCRIPAFVQFLKHHRIHAYNGDPFWWRVFNLHSLSRNHGHGVVSQTTRSPAQPWLLTHPHPSAMSTSIRP
jgi:asparagine synthase (glutamine-hydrolysing)